MGYKSKKRFSNKKGYKKNSKKRGGVNSITAESFSDASQGSLHLSDLQGEESNFGDDIESIPIAEGEQFQLDAVSSNNTSMESFPTVSSSLSNPLDQNADFSDYSPLTMTRSLTNSMSDAEEKTDSERSSFMNGGKPMHWNKKGGSRKNKQSKESKKSKKTRKSRKSSKTRK